MASESQEGKAIALDGHTRFVLAVIAGARVYLCVQLTPLPAVRAQTAARPGESTAPVHVVIVGWRAPQSDLGPMNVTTSPLPVSVRGSVQVTTERSTGRADRVVLVGWEERALC